MLGGKKQRAEVGGKDVWCSGGWLEKPSGEALFKLKPKWWEDVQVRKQAKCPCPVGRNSTSQGQGMEVACPGGNSRIPVWLEPSAGRSMVQHEARSWRTQGWCVCGEGGRQWVFRHWDFLGILDTGFVPICWWIRLIGRTPFGWKH